MERTKDSGKTRLDNEPHRIPDIRRVVAACYRYHEDWFRRPSINYINIDVRYFYIISDVIRNRWRNVAAILLEQTLSILGDLFSLIVRLQIFPQCMSLETMTNDYFMSNVTKEQGPR